MPATEARQERRVFIKTYGCQMNVYDSGRMAETLETGGYRATETPEDADLIILNTCHIREKAAEKVYSEIGRLKRLKAEREGVRIAVAGCVAQAEGQEILRRAPDVDLVFGPQTYHRLPDYIARLERGERHVVELDLPAEEKFRALDARGTRAARRGPTAFLTVQEGCDKFCTFCVVPYTRGGEISRPVERIEAEARRLVAGGVKEITLLGQNVNAYHGEGPDSRTWSLGRLIERLSEIEGLERLRYTTSHPLDMDETLIAAHRDNPKLMPFLHLPVQSGSDRLLKAMNRRHTRDDYRRIVERIRTARPDIALSSDFIVGFPGETEEDFRATLALVREVTFAQAFSFKYSPRPGTPAAGHAGQVPEEEKNDRLAELQALLDAQQSAFNRAFSGRRLGALIERPGKSPGQMVGRSPYLQTVLVAKGTAAVGEFVETRIERVGGRTLFAHIMGPEW
ncbi:MAG: tRNA (N6-isopentenyl adenosine(37)-C2)-methylthiotransferase MiaB [Parvibaculaceae bacterium]